MADVLPERPYEVLDARFDALINDNVKLERLAGGMRWLEGPAYLPAARRLVWSDIPNNRVMAWEAADGHVSEFRRPSNNTNGNTVDRQGRLVSCEHLTRRVVRTEHDGSTTVLADAYRGARLNSPNDVVVRSDGSVWFTDPAYGIESDYEGERQPGEQDGNHVYRVDGASGRITRVADDLDRPNGLAFSVEESRLYVSDTGAVPGIRVFEVDGKTLRGGEVFAVCDPGKSDGFRLDEHGNVWTSAADGVHCFAPDGTLTGKVKVPELVSNVCFGMARRNRLFITATTSLYAIYLLVRGAKTF